MGKIRLIQCGVGGHGRWWVEGVAPRSEDFEWVGIVDVNRSALEWAGGKIGLGEERWFSSLEEALEKTGAEAVLTVTPPGVHVEHARVAFGRGVHLMTEKPIAGTMEEAREMVGLAREAGKQLVVSQNYRYMNSCDRLKRLVRDERPLGGVGHGHLDFYIPADFTGTFREKMPYVLLMDMAIHHLDLIRHVTGKNILRVYAQTFNPDWSWYEGDCGLKMLLELEGGVRFSYSGDWSGKGKGTGWPGGWRVQCEEGSIHLEGGGIKVVRSERWGKEEREEVVDVPTLEWGEGHRTLRMFAEAIRTGVEAEVSGADNLWSFGAVMAGVRSTQTGEVVEVGEMVYGRGEVLAKEKGLVKKKVIGGKKAGGKVGKKGARKVAKKALKKAVKKVLKKKKEGRRELARGFGKMLSRARRR